MNKQRILRVGSRDSQLAVQQARIVMQSIQKAFPEIQMELITMKTTGDRILNRRLDQIGGKGLFVKELDQALRDDRIDISVHSLKDLPMEVPEDLPLMAFSKREDPRDVLIYRPEVTNQMLQQGGIIGSSSQRRILQLQKLYPACEFRSIRGNVQTRLRKLQEEDYQATVLAAAGVKRLSMEHVIGRYFTVEEIIPAAGQGIMVVQGRKGENIEILRQINCQSSEIAARCERSFVRELDGGCSAPIAAYAMIQGDQLILHGLYAEESKQDFITGYLQGSAQEPEALGIRLARLLKG